MEINIYFKPVDVLYENAYKRIFPKLDGTLKYRKRIKNRDKLKRRK